MPEDLTELAGEFEATLPIVMRQLYHVNENEPLGEVPMMQLRVVRLLFSEPKSVAAIAKELRMSPSGLAHLLARLEDAGLVARYDDVNDRRIRYAELTPLGIEQLTRRRSMRRERALRLLERLSPEERVQVMTTLKLLVERTGALNEPLMLEPDLEQRLPM